MKLAYPILIEQPSKPTEAWGISVPDLPGCFSAADEQANIITNAREAISFHLEALDEIPEPSNIFDIRKKRGFETALVDIDTGIFSGPAKRVNITIREGALMRVDKEAEKRGLSRSAFLVEAALREAG